MEKENKDKSLDIVKLSVLEKAIEQIKKEFAPHTDCDINFEFIIGSFFPKVLDNIKRTFTLNYMAGFEDAKKQYSNRKKKNN